MHNPDPDTAPCTPSSRRARGRPREFDRDAALGQAMRLFWAKGYEATSISDLTERMGIGTKSLYAAFGSKQQLYEAALQLYLRTYEGVVWDGFFKAATARESAKAYLRDSAIGMTASVADRPRGCMVTFAFVGSDGHEELNGLMRSSRAGVFDLLKARFKKALDEGELSRPSDVAKLARFVQTVQCGMAIRARDGAETAELQDVADVAMAGWDSVVGLTA